MSNGATSRLLSGGDTLLCAHGGHAAYSALSSRVFAAGMGVAKFGSPVVVSGCPLVPLGTGCVTGQWLTGATRVFVEGQPALLASGQSVCEPSGAPLIVAHTQTRVSGI